MIYNYSSLDSIINSSGTQGDLYIAILKSPKYKKGKSSKTWNNNEKDIIIIGIFLINYMILKINCLSNFSLFII